MKCIFTSLVLVAAFVAPCMGSYSIKNEITAIKEKLEEARSYDERAERSEEGAEFSEMTNCHSFAESQRYDAQRERERASEIREDSFNKLKELEEHAEKAERNY